MTAPLLRIDLRRARAFWYARQAIGSPRADIADVIARSGWLRTLGGADVYLAARARCAGLGRADLDAAVDAGDVRVVPAVRGCMYLVPRDHVPIALGVADASWRKRTDRELEKAGSSWKEIGEVGAAVLDAVAKGPLSTTAMRKALPKDALRSFGERGKKLGLSSPLPVALRDLELTGALERLPEGMRLDNERYAWKRARKPAGKSPRDVAALHSRLAEIFWSQMGVATIGDFAAWSCLSQREIKDAVARLEMAPIEVDGWADEAWVLERDRKELKAKAEESDAVALLSFEDNYLVSHGGPRWVVDERWHGEKVESWGGGKGGATLGDVKHLASRTFLVGDTIAGFWEYDPDAGTIVTAPLGRLDARMKRSLDVVTKDTARFFAADLGHARSFSLDTDDEVRSRAKKVRTRAK